MEQPINLDLSNVPALVASSNHCEDSFSSCSFTSNDMQNTSPRKNSWESFSSPMKTSLTTLQTCAVHESFSLFRIKYMLTYIAVTLADGLQGKFIRNVVLFLVLGTRRQHSYRTSIFLLSQSHTCTSCMRVMGTPHQLFTPLDSYRAQYSRLSRELLLIKLEGRKQPSFIAFWK